MEERKQLMQIICKTCRSY